MRVVVYLLAGLAGLWAAESHAAELPFDTATAQLRGVVHERLLDGRIEAVNEATITAQTSGQIVEIAYDVGDAVPQGAVVIRLRGREQRARVDEALARFTKAEADFERIRGIFEQKLVSKAEFDRAKAEYQAAKAALAQAQEQAGYTAVRAPYPGIVTQRHVEVGDVAQVGQPLVSGVSLDRLRVAVDVPERLIDEVRRESRARVILDEEPPRSVEVDQLTVFPYADPHANTVRVRLNLPESLERDGQPLVPGMLVKVGFAIGARERLAIPRVAVVYRGELTGVYVLDQDGSVRLRQVRLGHAALDDDALIEVLAGLDAGERVALDPIRAGVYVKERSAEGAQ
jgi:RND family efflux transporter MFP subunit